MPNHNANEIDWKSYYERRQRAETEVNARNKERVFDALAAAGITSVAVEFDGSGDSGQLDAPGAWRGADVADWPETEVNIETADTSYRSADEDVITTAQKSLQDAVEELCYGYLRLTHDGWENNDGAYGTFTLDVASRTVNLDFNERFMDTTHHGHVW